MTIPDYFFYLITFPHFFKVIKDRLIWDCIDLLTIDINRALVFFCSPGKNKNTFLNIFSYLFVDIDYINICLKMSKVI